jgi:hypothetical protein
MEVQSEGMFLLLASAIWLLPIVFFGWVALTLIRIRRLLEEALARLDRLEREP